MIDPTTYSITVKRTVIDGESLYQATVAELPDVVEYGETWSEAYELAIDAIEALQKLAQEMGQNFPSPSSEEIDFSGRVTLRMPKGLHKKISQRAETEGVSLNQYLVTVLAYAASSIGSYFENVAVQENEWMYAASYGKTYLDLINKIGGEVRVIETKASFDLPFSGEENARRRASDYVAIDLRSPTTPISTRKKVMKWYQKDVQ